MTIEYTTYISSATSAALAGVEIVPLVNNGAIFRTSTKSISDLASSTSGKFVGIGDSLMANGIGIADNAAGFYSTYYHQRGYINWFQGLVGFPFAHDCIYEGILPPSGGNLGVGGEQTKEMLARMNSQMLSQSPDHIYIEAGPNDVGNGALDANTVTNNIKQMIRNSLSVGATVWITTIFPRNSTSGAGTSGLTAAKEIVRKAVNVNIIQYANQMGNKVIVIDADTVLIDPSTGFLYTNYSYDGLHLNSLGAYKLAQLFLKKWQSFSGVTKIYRTMPAVYNVSTNPYGNIYNNGAQTGTSGTAGTGATGTIASNVTIERSIGSTVTAVASVVSQPDWNGNLANFQRVALSGTGTGIDPETIRWRQTPTTQTSGVITGNWYEGEVEVIIPAGTDRFLRSVYVQLSDSTPTPRFVRMFSTGYTNLSVKDIFPNEDLRLILRTPPIQAKGTTGFTFMVLMDVDCEITGSRTVDIGRPLVRTLPNMPQIYPDNVILSPDGSKFTIAVANDGTVSSVSA